MLGGALCVLSLFVIGWRGENTLTGMSTAFAPYYLFGVEPVVWGLAVSAALGVGVSLLSSPPPAPHVCKLFDAPCGANRDGLCANPETVGGESLRRRSV
jgi:SSS family solute:Na+ symporter/sodium/pantothenate symporter